MSRDRATNDAPIDWDEARRFLARAMSQHAGAGDSYIDDLVQEACVRLLRAQRRGPVTDLEALMRAVARGAWVDHIRRRTRARLYTEQFGRELETESSLNDPELGDLVDRLELVVQEMLDREGATDCKQLALEYFESRDWRVVSERLGLSYSAARKRWSRCVVRLRAAFARHPDFGHLVGGGE